MDQENKQSRDNFSLGFDDEAFNNLWDDSQYMSADKPLDEGADLLGVPWPKKCQLRSTWLRKPSHWKDV